MKHWFTRITATAALATGMLFAQTPAPQQGMGPHRMGMARTGMLDHLANYLNLTPDQKAQAKTIFQEARQTAQPVRDQLKQNRQALSDAVKTNKGDAAIDSLASNQGVLMGQLVANRTKAMAKVYALLTPDQRAKADQLKDHFQQRMGHRFGRQPQQQ
jgi:Spy/CpxP family protein refolding chaperone